MSKLKLAFQAPFEFCGQTLPSFSLTSESIKIKWDKEKKPNTTTTEYQKQQVGKTGLTVLQC